MTDLEQDKSIVLQSFSLIVYVNIVGLQALHEITSTWPYRLRVDLEDWEGDKRYAEYS